MLFHNQGPARQSLQTWASSCAGGSNRLGLWGEGAEFEPIKGTKDLDLKDGRRENQSPNWLTTYLLPRPWLLGLQRCRKRCRCLHWMLRDRLRSKLGFSFAAAFRGPSARQSQ